MRYPGVKSVKTIKTNKALTLNWDNTNKINFTDGGLLGAYDTTRGAEASAVTYSVIETAKANNLNVHEWLNYVLKVLPERFAYDPNDCIDDLLPWTDEMQKWFRLK